MTDSALWSQVAGFCDRLAGHGIRAPAEADLWQLFARQFRATWPAEA
jgi:hypothetical protein